MSIEAMKLKLALLTVLRVEPSKEEKSDAIQDTILKAKAEGLTPEQLRLLGWTEQS